MNLHPCNEELQILSISGHFLSDDLTLFERVSGTEEEAAVAGVWVEAMTRTPTVREETVSLTETVDHSGTVSPTSVIHSEHRGSTTRDHVTTLRTVTSAADPTGQNLLL